MLAPSQVAGAVCFFDYCCVSAMRTTLAFASRTLGGDASPLLLALLESAFGVGQVVGALTVGRLSDRRGRRAMLVLCVCCSALAYALAGSALAAGSVGLLLVSRLPAGISKQTTTTSRAIVCDSTSPSRRSSALSGLYACCALGYACGPLLGGWVTELGQPQHIAYYAACGFGAIAPSVSAVLQETRPAASVRVPPAASLGPGGGGASRQALVPPERTAWSQPAVRRVLLACSIPEAAVVMHTTVALPLLAHQLGISPSELGRVSAAQGLASAALSVGPLPRLLSSGRLGDSAALHATGALLLLASAALALNPSVTAVWCCIPAYALAVSLLRAISSSSVSKAASAAAQGEALGALDTVASLCRIVVPVVGGALATRHGAQAPYAAQVAMGALGLIALRWHRDDGDGVAAAAAASLRDKRR